MLKIFVCYNRKQLPVLILSSVKKISFGNIHRREKKFKALLIYLDFGLSLTNFKQISYDSKQKQVKVRNIHLVNITFVENDMLIQNDFLYGAKKIAYRKKFSYITHQLQTLSSLVRMCYFIKFQPTLNNTSTFHQNYLTFTAGEIYCKSYCS